VKEIRSGRRQLLLLANLASNVPIQIGQIQNNCNYDQNHPLKPQTENGDDEKQSPQSWEKIQSKPEQSGFLRIDHIFLVFRSRFKNPFAPSIIVNVIPPPKANQNSSRDIFDGPEIDRQEDDDGKEAADEAVTEPAAEKVD